ncbi:MAG: hypothetical protein PHT53_01645 [Candidatus Omnitrophica bacterium]|nr:hypothetical protein [Candidatus Omnitrophota bacterium]
MKANMDWQSSGKIDFLKQDVKISDETANPRIKLFLRMAILFIVFFVLCQSLLLNNVNSFVFGGNVYAESGIEIQTPPLSLSETKPQASPAVSAGSNLTVSEIQTQAVQVWGSTTPDYHTFMTTFQNTPGHRVSLAYQQLYPSSPTHYVTPGGSWGQATVSLQGGATIPVGTTFVSSAPRTVLGNPDDSPSTLTANGSLGIRSPSTVVSGPVSIVGFGRVNIAGSTITQSNPDSGLHLGGQLSGIINSNTFNRINLSDAGSYIIYHDNTFAGGQIRASGGAFKDSYGNAFNGVSIFASSRAFNNSHNNIFSNGYIKAQGNAFNNITGSTFSNNTIHAYNNSFSNISKGVTFTGNKISATHYAFNNISGNVKFSDNNITSLGRSFIGIKGNTNFINNNILAYGKSFSSIDNAIFKGKIIKSLNGSFNAIGGLATFDNNFITARDYSFNGIYEKAKFINDNTIHAYGHSFSVINGNVEFKNNTIRAANDAFNSIHGNTLFDSNIIKAFAFDSPNRAFNNIDDNVSFVNNRITAYNDSFNKIHSTFGSPSNVHFDNNFIEAHNNSFNDINGNVEFKNNTIHATNSAFSRIYGNTRFDSNIIRTSGSTNKAFNLIGGNVEFVNNYITATGNSFNNICNTRFENNIIKTSGSNNKSFNAIGDNVDFVNNRITATGNSFSNIYPDIRFIDNEIKASDNSFANSSYALFEGNKITASGKAIENIHADKENIIFKIFTEGLIAIDGGPGDSRIIEEHENNTVPVLLGPPPVDPWATEQEKQITFNRWADDLIAKDSLYDSDIKKTKNNLASSSQLEGGYTISSNPDEGITSVLLDSPPANPAATQQESQEKFNLWADGLITINGGLGGSGIREPTEFTEINSNEDSLRWTGAINGGYQITKDGDGNISVILNPPMQSPVAELVIPRDSSNAGKGAGVSRGNIVGDRDASPADSTKPIVITGEGSVPLVSPTRGDADKQPSIAKSEPATMERGDKPPISKTYPYAPSRQLPADKTSDELPVAKSPGKQNNEVLKPESSQLPVIERGDKPPIVKSEPVTIDKPQPGESKPPVVQPKPDLRRSELPMIKGEPSGGQLPAIIKVKPSDGQPPVPTIIKTKPEPSRPPDGPMPSVCGPVVEYKDSNSYDNNGWRGRIFQWRRR